MTGRPDQLSDAPRARFRTQAHEGAGARRRAGQASLRKCRRRPFNHGALFRVELAYRLEEARVRHARTEIGPAIGLVLLRQKALAFALVQRAAGGALEGIEIEFGLLL